MSKQKLSQEERDILKDFEDGEFESVLSQKRIEELQAIAAETFKKDRRINIRLSSRDLEGLQRRALEEGMPYQTLVSGAAQDSKSVLAMRVTICSGVTFITMRS